MVWSCVDNVDNVDKDEVKTALNQGMPYLELFEDIHTTVDKTQKIHIKNANYAHFNVDNVDN